MLPDRILNEIKEQVELYFASNDHRLVKAAHELADHGWSWDSMRPLLATVYQAGRDRGPHEHQVVETWEERVDYTAPHGGRSTADCEYRYKTTAWGTNKWTDEPLVLKWNTSLLEWVSQDIGARMGFNFWHVDRQDFALPLLWDGHSWTLEAQR